MPIEIRGPIDFPGSPAYVAARKKLTEEKYRPGITSGQKKHFEELIDELGAAREQENDALIAPVLAKMSFNENASPYNRTLHKIEEGLNRTDLTDNERIRLEKLRRELQNTKYSVDLDGKAYHTPESRRYQHEGIEQVVQNLLDRVDNPNFSDSLNTATTRPKVRFQTDAERAQNLLDADPAATTAPPYDPNDRSEGWEQRKEAYFENEVRKAKAELAAREAARAANNAITPEELAKVVRNASREPSSSTTALPYDPNDRSEGWEQRKEAYFEKAVREAKAGLAAEEAARAANNAITPEELAKVVRNASREPSSSTTALMADKRERFSRESADARARQAEKYARRAARSERNPGGEDNWDTQSTTSNADSVTANALNVASANNQEMTHAKQKELDDFVEEMQKQAFKIKDSAQSNPDEHYLTTMNKWFAEKIMEYAARNVTHPNEVAVDSPLIAIAEERLLKKMKDGEKLSPDEQRLKSYFTEVYRKRDEPTESEEILQSAMNPISRPEVEELMNPHLESMMDVMAKRANRHFIEERDRRIKEHEKRELSAFSGSNWNSGARKKFNSEFYDQEQKRRRDFEENLIDQEAKLLFQGDIEGWARARGNRDALERASQNKESISRNKFNNTSDAVKQNVMLDEARKNRIMSHTLASRNVGLDATQRNQDFLNRMSAQNHRNEAEPFNRLTAASAAINGRQPFPVQQTSMPAYNPPVPTRSGYSDAAALALAAQGGMAQQQNLAQQNEYYRLQNEELKRKQAQAALAGGTR